jgi:hypothetical protein
MLDDRVFYDPHAHGEGGASDQAGDRLHNPLRDLVSGLVNITGTSAASRCSANFTAASPPMEWPITVIGLGSRR